MAKRFLFWVLVLVILMTGCDNSADEYFAESYIPVSSISEGGFARNETELQDIQSQEIKLWGYVDHRNMYGNQSAKQILQEWWSGVRTVSSPV